MTFDASLARAGYLLPHAGAVWTRAGYAGIAYSDGDAVEERLGGIIAKASDLSVLSTELEGRVTDWPSLYHLSSTRANILRPFGELLEGSEVLEIGAGCGALTRFLGECGARVLALEGSPRRAAIGRSRTRDLANVTVVADRFDQFDFPGQFDVITLVGVLEYAPLFTPGDDPAARMLSQVRELLRPGGRLIVAIENQLGLKYFAGCAEDHLNVPMYGIEGRYDDGEPRTFGRRELDALLRRAGFVGMEFLAPFPDYKLPVSIVTEQGFACESFDAGALAWQSARRDPLLPQHLVFAPELAWQVIAANGLGIDLANSFLVLAHTRPPVSSEAGVLAYHYSASGRRAAYCKETRFLRRSDGGIELRYIRLREDCECPATDIIRFHVPARAEYVAGTPLSLHLMRIVTRDGWKFEEVARFLRRYLLIVEAFASMHGSPVRIDSPLTMLPGACFDIILQNILMAADGSWHVIDQEWTMTEPIPAGWLLFRALIPFASSLTRFGLPGDTFPATRIGFVETALRSVGLGEDHLDIESYSSRETAVQAAVRGSAMLHDWWGSKEPLAFRLLYQEHAERGRLLDQWKRAAQAGDARQKSPPGGQREAKPENNQSGQTAPGARPPALAQILRAGVGSVLRRFGLGTEKGYRCLRRALEKDPVLDPAWYLVQYPDVRSMSPIQHYSLFGAREGRNPNPLFWTSWYLREYPDVAASGMNPLLHYLLHGVVEGRNPCPYFFTAWYMATYPQAAASGVHPLIHYLRFGIIEQTSPNPYFDAPRYIEQYPEVARHGFEPLLHYIIHGVTQGKNPSPYFDTRWYLEEYPEVAAQGIHPLLHYLRDGFREGKRPSPYLDAPWYRAQYGGTLGVDSDPLLHYLDNWKKRRVNPNPYFDVDWYLTAYGEELAGGMEPLRHYIEIGACEGKNPCPCFNTTWYAKENSEVRESSMNPLFHFLARGLREGRHPVPPDLRGLKILTDDRVLSSILSVASGDIGNGRIVQGCVDVIIPVYKGLDETKRCIASVLNSKNRTAFRIILINDRTPDPDLDAYLRATASRENVHLIEHAENLGFTASANAGMRESRDNDVLLLNSDTEVADGLLDKLHAHAYAEAGIGTVTPFSNNATICSYPTFAGMATLPEGEDVGHMDAAFFRANRGRRLTLPTAIGFCMYIRRDCLQDVGLFDVETFGRGYGEENDFCLRASTKGWRHVLAADTFVYHAGEISFQAESHQRKTQAMEVLRARHPGYEASVIRHLEEDLAFPFRIAATAARFRQSGRPVVVHVSHALGGGVEKHVEELCRRISGRVHSLVLTPLVTSGSNTCLRLRSPNPADGLDFAFKAGVDYLVSLFRSFGVSAFHFHQLAGHVIDFAEIVGRVNAPFYLTIHDYMLLCPRVNLMFRGESYCGERGRDQCSNCLAGTELDRYKGIEDWRAGYGWLFDRARAVICPSRDAALRCLRYHRHAHCLVVPHERYHPDCSQPVLVPEAAAHIPLRIAVLGVLARHKGADVIAKLVDTIQRDGLPLQLRLIGHSDGDIAAPAIVYAETGPYADDQILQLIDAFNPHLILFPVQWPETYSYTLTAALRSNRPLMIPDLGALPERVQGRAWTWVFARDLGGEQLARRLGEIRNHNFIDRVEPPATRVGLGDDVALPSRYDWYEQDYGREPGVDHPGDDGSARADARSGLVDRGVEAG